MENNIFYLFYSGWLIQMTILDDYFGLLFQRTISDAYFRCLFQMTFPDDCSEWLFRMPPNDCFGLLFQMNISEACFRWLSRMTVRNSTTDSYFSDQFVFPRSIPISANHSTDWSHNWFDFERLLPTAELWPRSPSWYIDQKRLNGSEVSTTYYLNNDFAVERLLRNSTTVS